MISVCQTSGTATQELFSPWQRCLILVKTKLYDVISVFQTSGTATEELFSPWKQRQKLVKTVFHIHGKMYLFFFCKMTHLKFLCVVLITASAQVVQVIKVDI